MDTLEFGSGRTRMAWLPPGGEPVARWLAAAGFVALLTAQLLPWVTIEFPSGGVGGAVRTLPSDTYFLGWAALFALLGLALLGTGTLRRVGLAAGAGLTAGMVVATVAELRSTGSLAGDGITVQTTSHAHSGVVMTALALLLVAAAQVALVLPERPLRTVEVIEIDQAPERSGTGLELTVRAVPRSEG